MTDRDTYAYVSELRGENRELVTALANLRRAYATTVIEAMLRIDHLAKDRGEADDFLLGLKNRGLDPQVAALIDEYVDHRVGECEACGKRAPLTKSGNSSGECSVCAWGCSV